MPSGAADPTGSVQVHVTARAAADAVGPFVDGVLRVRVTAPPAEGRANEAVRRLLADVLGLAPSRVRLVAGERARSKRFEVLGMSGQQLVARLGHLSPD